MKYYQFTIFWCVEEKSVLRNVLKLNEKNCYCMNEITQKTSNMIIL
jgi:hypothetical protein